MNNSVTKTTKQLAAAVINRLLFFQATIIAVISALSVGLFGMFIACIIPEGKKNKVVAVVIIVSFIASYLLSIIPGVKSIDSGLKIIILTVVIAGIFCVVKPVDKEVPNE